MTNASNIVVEPPIDGISRIKLNEPSTYNALSSKTLESLINIFKNLNNEKAFRDLGSGFVVISIIGASLNVF